MTETAKIYQPTKTAMQSGKGNTKYWLLEFDQGDTRFIEPLMGWTGNTDNLQQLRLKFPTQDAAIKYAESKNIHYRLIQPNNAKPKIQAYSDNFM